VTENKGILNNIIIVIAITILAKFVSFLANIVVAMYLGLSVESDAYSMLIGIHNVFYPMLSVGIWKIFLPEYNKKIIADGLVEAGRYANKLMSWFLLLSIAVVLIFWFNSNIIVDFMAPGFDAETKAISANLFKLASPQYIFIIIAAFYSVMLQANNKFFASQIREVVTFIPFILFFISFYKKIGITACAYGLILGAIARFFVQIPFVDWGYKFKFDYGDLNSDFWGFIKKMPNVLFSTSIGQLNLVIINVLASGLGVGTIASLGYAARLNNVFNGLISYAIGVVIYPIIAKYVSLNDKKRISELLNEAFGAIGFFILPISFFCNLFAKDIVAIVYERGIFDSLASELTGSIFAVLAFGMFFSGLLDIFFNFYYAFGNTKIPLGVSFVLVITNVIIGFTLSSRYGVMGLVFSTVFALFLGIGILMFFFNKYIDFPYKSAFTEQSKIILSSGISWIITKGLSHFLLLGSVFLKVFTLVIVFFIIYLLMLYFIKSVYIKKYYFILKTKVIH